MDGQLSPEEMALLLRKMTAGNQSAPGILDELQANPQGLGYDAPQAPDPMSVLPFGDPGGELRSDGPGEPTGQDRGSMDEYSRSGFAGQLEPTLAQDVTSVVPWAGMTYLASSLGPPAIETLPAIAQDIGGAFAPGANADENPLQQLYRDREALVKQRDAADRERQIEMRTGKGPRHDAAMAAYEDVAARLGALDRMIQGKERENSPEFKLEMQAKQTEQDRAQRLKEANTPFKEKFADYMPWAPIVAALGAYGLGRTIKGRYVDKFNTKVDDLNSRWSGVTEKGNAALKRGNMKSATQLSDEAKELRDQLDAIQKKGPGGTLAAVGAGASVGELSQLGPTAIDYARATPGSELYDKTMESMTNPTELAGRVAQGAALGGVPAEIGSTLAKSKLRAPTGFKAETTGLNNALGAEKTARQKAERAASRDKNKATPLTAEPQKALPAPKTEFVPGQRADPKSGMGQAELKEKLTDFAEAWFSVNNGKNIKSTHILNIAKQNGLDMSLGQATRLARRLNNEYGERYINAGAKAALTKKE